MQNLCSGRTSVPQTSHCIPIASLRNRAAPDGALGTTRRRQLPVAGYQPPQSRVAGRFAPSPTGDLHLGNLRTALAAFLVAAGRGQPMLLRIEDLDRVASAPEHEASQRRDLRAIGVDWAPPVLRQSERFAIYDAALAALTAAGSTYECFCTRREIRDAVAAPHGAELVYPGTCRDLSGAERRRRRRERPPAIRLRGDGAVAFDDLVVGRVEGEVTDVVLRRNDGVPAYNLAVVVDDAATGVDHIVRGDDLVSSTPAQIAVQAALGLPHPIYVHIPLVVGPGGQRLAKRDGAVTLADLAAVGIPPARVGAALVASLGLDVGPDVDRNRLRDVAPLLDPAMLGTRGPVTLASLALH